VILEHDSKMNLTGRWGLLSSWMLPALSGFPVSHLATHNPPPSLTHTHTQHTQ